MADPVVSPVRPGDVAGKGRVRSPTGLRPDRRQRTDEEPRRVDIGGVGEAGPIRRPGKFADIAVGAAPELTTATTLDPDQLDGRRRIGVVQMPDAGDQTAVRRDPWPAVTDMAGGQAPRPRRSILAERHDPKVGLVAVPADGPAADHREAAIGGDVMLLQEDLAADVLGDERASVRHRAQGSGVAVGDDRRGGSSPMP